MNNQKKKNILKKKIHLELQNQQKEKDLKNKISLQTKKDKDKKTNINQSEKQKKNQKKNQKKKAVIPIVASMLLVFSLVFGVSYGFFTTTTRAKEFVMYTGTLAVSYQATNNTINLDKLYPMTDAEGLTQNSHSFTVNNNGNIDARYQIRLELDETEKNMIPLEYVKLSYKKNTDEFSEPILLSNLDSSLAFIRNEILESNHSDTYEIKLWIDLGAPNEIQGKTFSARVVVDSIQNVDDGYVVDTAPIITLKKDKDGNQDIHLKVGEKYTELGVAEIKDDQEIFTNENVITSYEHVNDNEIEPVNEINTEEPGIYYVNYEVTDKSNNKGTATRVVVINKTDIVPTIVLKNEEPIILGEGDYYKEPGVEIENNNQVTIIGEVKTSVIGTYTVRYIVIDENGNLNSVIRTVKVEKAYQEDILKGTDPVLKGNLIPVIIEENGTVKRISTKDEWYDYETKKWANAIILKDENKKYGNNDIIPEEDIESYFVWIPKYSYQIFNTENYNSVTTIETKAQEINIKFGTENTSDINKQECTTPMKAGSIGICSNGDYMTHPAFISFNVNGFWVGKFETGYLDATSAKEAEQNSSDYSKIIIKPNVYSWRNITVGNAFEASYNYQRNLDSHMMKNTEWGAVAYLSHSKYGTCSNNKCSEIRINNNSGYITGYAATKEPTTGRSSSSTEENKYEGTNLGADGTATLNYKNSGANVASTTGNKTGIYDMNGGSLEYIMGYTTSATNDSSGITSIHQGFFNNSDWKKYYDSYNSTQSPQFGNRILGDATGEMGPFGIEKDPDTNQRYKSSWYKDQAYFVYSTNPWFRRGGSWIDGINAGIFVFDNYNGDVKSEGTYRIVLAP